MQGTLHNANITVVISFNVNQLPLWWYSARVFTTFAFLNPLHKLQRTPLMLIPSQERTSLVHHQNPQHADNYAALPSLPPPRRTSSMSSMQT